jgi:lysyl-tRNA synthetase class 2
MINIDALHARAGIIRRIRAFFDNLGFLEVETPVRIAAPAPEEYIDCPSVAGGGFLRASPELQMKKLLAAGMERIYQIGPCFREGESGERHNPEFTMLEWYRRDASYLDIADDLERLLAELSGGAIGGVKRLKVREAYLKYAGWDPWENWDRDRFDFDVAVKIEPALKELGGGVFLTDYPREAASLAVTRGDHAERWEFYLDGVELANCFTELCDREEQKARFVRAK